MHMHTTNLYKLPLVERVKKLNDIYLAAQTTGDHIAACTARERIHLELEAALRKRRQRREEAK